MRDGIKTILLATLLLANSSYAGPMEYTVRLTIDNLSDNALDILYSTRDVEPGYTATPEQKVKQVKAGFITSSVLSSGYPFILGIDSISINGKRCITKNWSGPILRYAEYPEAQLSLMAYGDNNGCQVFVAQ